MRYLPWQRVRRLASNVVGRRKAARIHRRLIRALLWPRLRLDLSVRVLGYAVLACTKPKCPSNANVLPMDDGSSAIPCLSVRSGFDALLSVLQLPVGSEVVLSALTHPDMARIVKEHGLVPVPADIDAEYLAPTPREIAERITARTRIVVIAHLFGTRTELGPIAQIAKSHGLLLVEDSAQWFEGLQDLGSPAADVSLFSFGPMKTCSAMGGGIIHIRDQQLADRVSRLLTTYPVQTRTEFFRRTCRFGFVLLASRPRLYFLFAAALSWRGRDLDQVVVSLVRSVQSDLIPRIRRRPSTPLLAVMNYRLARFDLARLAARTRLARQMSRELRGYVRCPGACAIGAPNWVFPVLTESPTALRQALRAAGFDSSGVTTGISVVCAPLDSPSGQPREAIRILKAITFIPLYPELPPSAVDRLVAVTRRVAAGGSIVG